MIKYKEWCSATHTNNNMQILNLRENCYLVFLFNTKWQYVPKFFETKVFCFFFFNEYDEAQVLKLEGRMHY
jgi:hypothetical protein